MNIFNGTSSFSLEELGDDFSSLPFFYNRTNTSFFDFPRMSPSMELFRDTITWMERVVLPAIIIVGVMGNSVSFLVFMCSHLRRLSSSVYLAALSLADAGFLLCMLIKWANDLGVPLLYNDQWCQLFLYVSCVFSFLSVWYVVSFSAERFIAVCLPFQRQDMCTPKRAKFVVTALAGLAFLTYTFVIWTSEMKIPFMSKITTCLPKKEYHHLWTCFYSIDTIFTLIIPSIAIIFLNIRIIVAVVRLHRDARRMNEHGDYRHVRGIPISKSTSKCAKCCRGGRSHGDKNTRTTPHSSQVKVTKMLVTVSTTFLLLNLPTHCLRLYTFITFMSVDAKYYPHSQVFRQLQRLFLLVHYSNFAVNFIIYNICGRNFRLGLKHLVKRIRHNARKCWQSNYPNATTTTTLTADPINRVYADPNVIGQAEIRSNGMHFRLQKVHSRSTSSSNKPLVGRRRRRQIKLKCRWENDKS